MATARETLKLYEPIISLSISYEKDKKPNIMECQKEERTLEKERLLLLEEKDI